MANKLTIEVGGEAGTQHRWSCLSCGTMGPWTHQSIAVVGGEEHGCQHPDEEHEVHHRDEDLDGILQNLAIPVEGDSPPGISN